MVAMKKILYLFEIGCMLLNSACSDMLNLEPENSVTYTNFFKSEQDLETFTGSIHSSLADVMTQFWGVEYAGVLADASPSGNAMTPPGLFRFHGWDVTGSMSWKPFYDVIYLCNTMFKNVESSVCSEERLNFYFGQADFAKGMCYFQLAKYWGDAVISGDTEDPSPRAKSPGAVVLDTALACARRAFDKVPVYESMVNRMGAKITSKQYACKGSVAALIANIYAWRAGVQKGLTEAERTAYWQEAEVWATKVIDKDANGKYECGQYELEDTPELLVTNTINGRGGKESIFELELNSKDGSLNGQAFTSASLFVSFPIIPGKLPGDIKSSQWRISNSTVLKMYAGGDERKDAFFYKPQLYSDNLDSAQICGGNAFEYKFRKCLFGTGTTSEETLEFINFDVNRVYWRLADLILLRAEARVHTNNTAGAIADLKKIQQRAKADLYDGTEDLQLAIFREREKELIFEDHRWFDVLRNDGYYRTELPQQVIFVPFPFPHNEYQDVYGLLTEQDIENGALYLPIGEGAFNLNSLMIQNTYWFNK